MVVCGGLIMRGILNRGDTLKKRCMSLLLLFAAQLVSAELLVSDAYVRALPPGQAVTAAYMTLHNDAAKAIEIVAIRSQAAESVEVHQTVKKTERVSMLQLSSLTVAAGQKLYLKPGGVHLMLIGLKNDLQDGQQLNLELQLQDGRWQTLVLPVRSVLNEHSIHHHQHH
jgi:copper(I)-binding protein